MKLDPVRLLVIAFALWVLFFSHDADAKPSSGGVGHEGRSVNDDPWAPYVDVYDNEGNLLFRQPRP